MLKFLVTPAACLLLVVCCDAQQKDSMPASKPERLSNQVMIKFAPLSVLNADGGLNFAVEYLLARQHIGLQMEAQPVLFSIQGDAGATGLDKPEGVLQSGPVHGIKLRPEVRYYTDILKLRYLKPRPNNHQTGQNPKNSKRPTTLTYLAAAVLYKQTLQQRTNEFYISNNGTQPGYRQQAEYTDVKKVTAFEFKMGVVKPVSNEHWFADVYFGVGIRIRKLSYRNLPAGANEPGRGGFLLGGPGTSSETFPLFRLVSG